MRTTMLSLTALGAVLAILHAAPAAAVNLNKTWVSHNGSDSFDCASPATACATFSGALGKTVSGGEIGVVDAGDYGGMLIAQSVNITNDGAGEASILGGIIVGAENGDVVSLRGLVIDGQGKPTGGPGIFILSGSAVHVQNCVIRNHEAAGLAYGIFVQPGHNVQLFVSDTVIFNNGSSARTAGIMIAPYASASVNVVLDRVHLENNVDGILVDGSAATGNGSHVIVRDSVISGNAANGIHALTLAGQAPAFLMVERTSSVNNAGTGILADGPHATVLLKESTIARNGTGVAAVNGGQLISYGNNSNNNNLASEGSPTGYYSGF